MGMEVERDTSSDNTEFDVWYQDISCASHTKHKRILQSEYNKMKNILRTY